MVNSFFQKLAALTLSLKGTLEGNKLLLNNLLTIMQSK